MHEMRGPDQVPGGSRIARVLGRVVRGADFRGLWVEARVHFAVTGLLLSVAGLVSSVAELAAPHAGSVAAWVLVAGASAAGLLSWVCFVAVPFAARGQLPSGRSLGDVLMRRRMRRQAARVQRQALRQWRESPRYRGPHGHRRPRSLPPSPDEDT